MSLGAGHQLRSSRSLQRQTETGPSTRLDEVGITKHSTACRHHPQPVTRRLIRQRTRRTPPPKDGHSESTERHRRTESSARKQHPPSMPSPPKNPKSQHDLAEGIQFLCNTSIFIHVLQTLNSRGGWGKQGGDGRTSR